MRLCVLADIHGNLAALQAVVDQARDTGVDRWACLGDVVGYGPHPGECLDLLRSLDCVILQGNHEAGLLDLPTRGRFNDLAQLALDHSRRVLSEEQVAYLRTLPPRLELGGEILLSHGSPEDRDEYLLFGPQLEDAVERADHWLTFVGHSHLQFLHDGERWLHGEQPRLKLSRERRYVINPGSVGQPRDQDPRAAWARWDDEAEELRLLRCEYDVEATVAAYREAGLPEYSWQRLRLGR